jgi:5-carboxymethyl-2-hydroxymuconate isomerase
MPHLVLEYTGSVVSDETVKSILVPLNAAVLATGHVIAPTDLKTRTMPVHDFQIGYGMEAGGFVHARLSLLEGRSPEAVQEMAQAVLNVLVTLRERTKVPLQISVECVCMERPFYKKG